VPLRARNELLVAAGFAPEYGQTDLDAPGMAPVRDDLDLVLGHAEPYPALVVDRHWQLVRTNAGLDLLLDALHEELAAHHPAGARGTPATERVGPVLPLVLRTPRGRLSLLTTATRFARPPRRPSRS
jgi:hypothetical protein